MYVYILSEIKFYYYIIIHTSKILVTYTLLIHQRYSLLILYSYIKDTRYLYFTHTSMILATYTLLIHQRYLTTYTLLIHDQRYSLLILYSYRGRPWRYSVIPSTPDFPTEYQIRRHSNPAGLPTFAAIWGPDFRAIASLD